jgi:glycosyltransferase involved in cell wall biosynthesis
VNVHQILSGAGPRDAVTADALQFRKRFAAWGWGGGDHARLIVPGLDGAVAPLGSLAAAPEDVLLIHHSAGNPRLSQLLALPNPKLLLYHNITPPHWLWDLAPVVAATCYVGRDQLSELVQRVELAAGVSDFNAQELRALGASETTVIPPLLDLAALGPPTSAETATAAEPPGPPTILFVGRLAPHKRQDEVIRAFALYRRHRQPDARLVLVGDSITSTYGLRLSRLAEEQAPPGAVTIESDLSAEELGARYRSAHAFLCLSEHEGFCIPLLEAFHFGVPVVARAAGAVPETAGNAALLVDDSDLAVVAELLHLCVRDQGLRSRLRERGLARVQAYAPDVVAERLKTAIDQTRRFSRTGGLVAAGH